MFTSQWKSVEQRQQHLVCQDNNKEIIRIKEGADGYLRPHLYYLLCKTMETFLCQYLIQKETVVKFVALTLT